MKIVNYNRFRLLKKDLPEIINKVVVQDDVNVGGIKLVYEVSLRDCFILNFFGRQRLVELPSYKKSKKIIRVFLRPYKKLWSEKRDKKLPKNFWGKNDELLTQLWVELEFDYIDLQSAIIILTKEIRDTNITKHLSKTKNLFYVKSKLNQFV